MNQLLEIIRRPVVTEKSTILATQDRYVFEVASWANKIQIKQAVETAFNVDVVDVHTMTMPGKMRRVRRNRGMTSPWKKAIVQVQPGQKIEVFEGV
ncbi:MAG: 50S ribosomal protein L23 [Dehalococcoidia bacterium]|nr:MAG: 50S ribosomal protein L23 [Dehalococcoidia bacterium]